MNELHAAALAYTQKGIYVFPCDRQKRPLTGEGGYKNATIDCEAVNSFWARNPRANIGIALEASGLIVIDVDGPSGIEPLFGLGLPPTRVVTTGRPEGGFHHYYRPPAGLTIRTAKLAEQLDLRGAGAYVIASPSVHASGARYASNGAGIETLTIAEAKRLQALGKPPRLERSPDWKPRDPSGDPLRGIDPPAYVWLLTGRTVNAQGKMPCPLHDDWDGDGGSFHAYSTAERGWYCYGCCKGGSIYDLALALWGEQRFPDLRRRLAAALIGGGVHA